MHVRFLELLSLYWFGTRVSQGISNCIRRDVYNTQYMGLIIHCQHSFLELFVGDPKANVPCHQSGKGRVEALVKCKEPFILGRFHRTWHGASVTSIRAVHKPENDKLSYCTFNLKTIRYALTLFLPHRRGRRPTLRKSRQRPRQKSDRESHHSWSCCW